MPGSGPNQIAATEERTAILSLLRDRIRGFASYLGCSPEDAADIAQETLAVLHVKYPEERRIDVLIRIANRICWNFVKNHQRRKDSPAGPDQLDLLRDRGANPEQAFANVEFQNALIRLIEKDDTRCKTLLLLDLDGAETNEICSRLGLDRDNLYVFRTRCRKKLRVLLGLLK